MTINKTEVSKQVDRFINTYGTLSIKILPEIITSHDEVKLYGKIFYGSREFYIDIFKGVCDYYDIKVEVL